MPAEQTRVFSFRVMLWLLLAPLAAAYPATSSFQDARCTFPEPAGRETVEPWCGSSLHQNLSFPDGVRAAPLTRGPCADGEWVVHDLAAAEGPRLRCALRPCPNGQLPLKGRCLAHADASAALCSGGPVQLESTGLPCCVSPSEEAEPTTAIPITPPQVHPTAVAVGPVHCAQGDGGQCQKEVRPASTSGPDLQPEN